MKRQTVNIASNYRRLIGAVINQAVKDKAIWFLETETGREYCAIAGINPACTGAGISHNAGEPAKGEI